MGRNRLRLAVFSVALASVALRAQTPAPHDTHAELQIADTLSQQLRFRDAAAVYRHALADATALNDGAAVRLARTGLASSLLRIGDFIGARAAARPLADAADATAVELALYGDTLWAFGLFDEADRAYDSAMRLDGSLGRPHQGRARSLVARGQLEEALVEAQTAVRLAPDEAEFHHTVGVVYERQHRYDLGAAAFGDYLDRIPRKEHSDRVLWTRAEIRFLQSFSGRTPIDIQGSASSWTIPVRVEHDKVLVAVKVNGGKPVDFVLDTGAEQTVLSRDLARRHAVFPIAFVQSAGVGDAGLRPLEVGRIDSMEIGDLKIRDVPCVIKNPPLNNLPAREPESFSPVALGLSMQIDYARRQLVIARTLPEATHTIDLPLRMYRLATVRGVVNGQPASFVVDTGGEVISISASTAGLVADPGGYRRIPLKVYGTSGWDKDAFLMPNVDLEFSSIRFSKIPVVVLNLRAPSTLLGFQLGGIVGHTFLSKYRVSLDLQRSVVGLDANP